MPSDLVDDEMNITRLENVFFHAKQRNQLAITDQNDKLKK